MRIDELTYESQPWRTSRQSVPRSQFKIEGGEAFIITPQDEKELGNVNEALTCPARKNGLK